MTAILTDALCGIADVKESLGIVDNSKNNLITRKINQATRVIQNYCDNSFSSVAYVEEYDSGFGQVITLRHWPIISFTKLEYRGTNLNDATQFNTATSNLYFVDTASGVVKFLDSFWGGFNQWRATYTAGYATVPADVAEACVQLACWYLANPTSGVGVRMVREGQRETQYQMDNHSKNLIQRLGLDAILDNYTDQPITGDR